MCSKLVDVLNAKMEAAKAEYLRVVELNKQDKAHFSRLYYHQGLYDGLERAWREAVFAQQEAERDATI